ncbi:MAG: hypothetical protein HC860_14575 [Alkalinema sp. RU_4_3]|nr:hypothetical protein [Alkalinema sp. RU_4_3]
MGLRWYWGLGLSGVLLLGGIEGSFAATTSTPQLEILAPVTGGIRVRNRSASPVRIVILRRPKPKATKPSIPIHWDFAPREGRLKGFLLALPNETITLDRGDIVTAFAQDGSARYWGPYVVGESSQPIWNDKTTEWEVTLEE